MARNTNLRGMFMPGTLYKPQHIVSFLRGFYMCTEETTESPLNAPRSWRLIGMDHSRRSSV